MRFILTLLLVFTAFQVSAAEEMVCVQDLNNNGYAGESGETATCESNLKEDQFFCPIGARQCIAGQQIVAEPAVYSCPSGYELNSTGEICQKENTLEEAPTKSCPEGYSYNGVSGECSKTTTTSSNPIYSCQTGFTFNAVTGLCEKGATSTTNPTYSCPSGFSYNNNTALCSRTVTNSYMPQTTCPSGQRLEGNRCVQTISATACLSDPALSVCRFEFPHNYVRHSGTWVQGDWDGSAFETTQDGSGTFTVNNALFKIGERVRTVPPGNVFLARICKCNQFMDMGPPQVSCSTGNYDASTNRCLVTATETGYPSINCSSGTYDTASRLCISNTFVTQNPTISCSSGVYDTNTKRCVATNTETTQVLISCGPGFNYNPGKGVCEKTEVLTIAVLIDCPAGMTYRPSKKQCEKINETQSCPLGGANACVLSSNGKHYCSSNPCMSLKDAQEVGEIDGGMLVDNGEKDDEGMCLDQVLIFSGKASYCQLSGKSTAFQNCCKNDGEVTNDSMGSSSEMSMAVDTLQAMYKVTSAAYSAYSSTLASGGTQTAAANAASSAANTQIQALMNPATIAWAVVIYLVLDYLMQACDAMSMETSMNAESGFCHEVGTYCKTEWLGSCVQKAVGYCCFNSKMGRIIHEQGRPQLKGFSDWGPPKNPDCRGFTPEEFRSLDFSKIDMSEYYEDLVHKTQDQIQDTMMDLTNDYFESVK